MKSRWRFSIFVSVLLIGVPIHAERRDVATSDQFAMSDGRIAARPGGTSVLSKGKIRSLSTSSFQGFVHCPAELHEQCTDPFGSIPMDANTAYFRDVIIGAWTSISNATNGETWGATFTDPKTTAHVFPTVTFYSSYAGQQDCFVFGGGAYLCGSTSVDVLWYLQSQCLPPGTWKAEFSNTSIPPQFFQYKSQIDPQYIPLQLQTSWPNSDPPAPGTTYSNGPNPYDSICRRNIKDNRDVLPCAWDQAVPSGLARWSISGKGCYMTDMAMVLSYHGYSPDANKKFTTNPKLLNDALNPMGRTGFERGGNVNPPGVIRYGNNNKVKIQYPIASGNPIGNDICTYGPQLVRVIKDTQHWVTAYGIDTDGSSILVRDPNAGKLSKLAGIMDKRVIAGPQFNFSDQITGIKFVFHSPVEAFVTDPMGRRAGVDPQTQTTYNEIPNAYYDQDHGEIDGDTGLPDPNPAKALEVWGDVDGDYVVTVTGTATGTYDTEAWAVDLTGNVPYFSIDGVPTDVNLVNTYTIHFNHLDATQSTLSGGFDGGGQRPKDVNKFLTYGNPAASQTSLPAGTTSFALVIFYANGIVPTTFTADLNGVSMASLFHPAGGTSEVVHLPVASGRNVLKLSVDGQLPTRVATDTDRLVLQVP